MKKHIVRGKPYFLDTINNVKSFPALEEDISTDVVIVGGGITGALCAYYFMKNNINTTIIEKSKITHGSTSITTSLLQYELDDQIIDLEKDFNLNQVMSGYNFSKKALSELNNIINQLNLDCDYKARDCLLYTNDKNKTEKLKYEYEKRKENGFEVKFITNDTSDFDFSFGIEAGVYSFNGGAEINPVKFTHGLIKYVFENGVNIFENTEIIGFEDIGSSIKLKSSNNKTITCKKLIVATGYDISTFSKEKFCTLYTTYNIVTSPINNIRGYHNRCLIKTAENTYSYLRTTFDNRIIIGGEDTRFIPEILENNIAELRYNKLREKLNSMFPQLNFTIDYKYNGIFGITDDNLPFVGPGKKNKKIWYCLGYGANGILFAINGAQMLSNLYLGTFNKDFNLVSLNRE